MRAGGFPVANVNLFHFRIREESRVFEDMFRATVDIANRLEVSSQALHAAFTKQLKDISKNQHKRKLRRA